MNIEHLMKIQAELKAPKEQHNKFGGFMYRSCEDILEAVKPLLVKYGCVLIMNDEIVMVGNRYYVKATATLLHGGDDDPSNIFTAEAYAREDESKKGMDSAQLSGATSSYARKYALNALFAIDDNKDADYLGNGETKKSLEKPADGKKVDYNVGDFPTEQKTFNSINESFPDSKVLSTGAHKVYDLAGKTGAMVEFETEANIRFGLPEYREKATASDLDAFMLNLQAGSKGKGKGKTLDQLKESVMEQKGFQKLWDLYTASIDGKFTGYNK